MSLVRLLAISSLSLFAACTTAEPLDASGTWNLSFTTAPSGNCFMPNMVIPGKITASFDGTTYTFTPEDPQPGDTITGSFECTESECDFDMTTTQLGQTQGGAQFTLTTNLDLLIDEDLAITGTGSVSATGGVTCSHPFSSVTGTVQ